MFCFSLLVNISHLGSFCKQGTKVSTVFYGNDIRYFANLLQPFKRYYITGGTVKKQDAKYKVSDPLLMGDS